MSINKRSFSRFNGNLLLLGLVVLLRASLATAQVPSLVIDSGGSTRFVKSIVFTQNGKNIVSVGDDKVVRIWHVKTGKTTRAIRTPASGCGECVISALAVSNDEKYLALGGALPGGISDAKYAVYIYKFDTGQLLQLLKSHISEVTSLTFSPDGSQLASGGDGSNENGLLNSNPVRIWKLRSDRWEFERRLTGHKEAISSLSFSPDGKQLVSGSHDNYVGFWNLEDTTSNNASLQKSHSDQVTSVTFSPDGQYVASGSLDGRVKLWNSSGAFIKDLVTQTEGVASVVFSRKKDPLWLAVGLENGVCNVLSVPEGTAVSSARRPAHKFDDKVRALAFSPDGEIVASSGGFNGEISLWDADDGEPDGRETLAGQGETVWSVGFAKDGNSIAYGTKHTSSQPNNYGPLEKVVRLRARKSNSAEDGEPSRYRISVEDELDEPEDYLTARSESGGYKLTTRFGQTQTRVKGSETVQVPVREFRDLLVAKAGETQPRTPMTRSYDEGRTFRSFTLTSDGSHFISGGERGYLAMYKTEPEQGNRLKLVHRFFGHTNDVWAVALSADDQFLVSGSSDQTIKLWDVKSGFNILTIFVGKDREWVAWNTDGYYTSSMGGDKYFGWQINRGPEQMPEFYSAAQFAKEYHRPDVIGESFRAPDVKLAVTQADKLRLTQQSDALTAQVVDVRSILPPIITINTPAKDHTVVQDRMLRLKLYAVSNTLPITELRVSLNGVPKGTFKGDIGKPDKSKRIEIEMVVALAEGENKLFVVAENEGAVSKPQIRTIYYKPGSVPEFEESAQARQRNRGLGPRSVSHHAVRETVSTKPIPAVAAQPVPSPSPNDSANARVVVDVQSPREAVTTVEDENLTISANAVARLKNQVELKVFLNNHPDPQHIIRSPTSPLAKLQDVQVTLQPGENVLRFVATDGEVIATEEVRRVTYNPRVSSKPNLIFLGIGISKYELFRPQLSFADQDAKAVADLLLTQKGDGRPFQDVKVKLIADQEADREAIIEGLNWIKRETKFDNDVRVVLISGHGGIFEDNYFFFSHKHNPGGDPETDSIRWNLFWDKLIRPNSNAFLFVDTCRAGKASKDFSRDPDATGIFFFAASRAEETSLEDPRFGHGIFTQALLEGLRGERTLPGNRNADMNGDNHIDSWELQTFIIERVKALNSRQTPVIRPPTSLPNPIRLSTYPVPGP